MIKHIERSLNLLPHGTALKYPAYNSMWRFCFVKQIALGQAVLIRGNDMRGMSGGKKTPLTPPPRFQDSIFILVIQKHSWLIYTF